MSTYSKACCTIPPIVSIGYVEKGRYETIDGIKTYVTGPPSAKVAILVVYDIFGFFPQTLQGADILAFSDNEKRYRVFVPDFFEGKAADISWYPPTTEEHGAALGNFFGGVGAPSKAVARVPTIVSAFKAANPNVETLYALGMCWGGKVVTLASNTSSLFAAVAQAHPAMLDPADAKEVKVRMCVLASKDEPADEVSAYISSLSVPHYTETFGDQVHGWMAARADLEDANVSAKYRQGYETVLDFFGGRLTSRLPRQQMCYQVVLWPVKGSKAAVRLVDFILSLPTKAFRDGKPYVVASHAGATKAPLAGRTSKAQGFNVTSILTFKSEDDSVFFVTKDPAHNEMVAVVSDGLSKTPIVSSFKDLDTAFHPPTIVGDQKWTGVWQ